MSSYIPVSLTNSINKYKLERRDQKLYNNVENSSSTSSSSYNPHRLLESSDPAHWVPEKVKTGRFAGWLKSAKDWSISRNRYWVFIDEYIISVCIIFILGNTDSNLGK
jgi:valyl-tRNA synthetase